MPAGQEDLQIENKGAPEAAHNGSRDALFPVLPHGLRVGGDALHRRDHAEKGKPCFSPEIVDPHAEPGCKNSSYDPLSRKKQGVRMDLLM